MDEPSHLSGTRTSYDTIAEEYAELAKRLFADDGMAARRGMLTAFAELVRDGGGGPVADVGCGPGHVTAYLDSLGLTVSGIDLSPEMVRLARRDYPGLRFEVGSMTELDSAEGGLAGLVAWWSIIHLPPEELPGVFARFFRVLAPGGWALIGFHAGDSHVHLDEIYGHRVAHDSYRLPPDRIATQLEAAGFVVTDRLLSEGRRGERGACLLAHKPAPEPDRGVST